MSHNMLRPEHANSKLTKPRRTRPRSQSFPNPDFSTSPDALTVQIGLSRKGSWKSLRNASNAGGPGGRSSRSPPITDRTIEFEWVFAGPSVAASSVSPPRTAPAVPPTPTSTPASTTGRRRSHSASIMSLFGRKSKKPPPTGPIPPTPKPQSYTLPTVPSTSMPELQKFLVSPQTGGQSPGKAKVSTEASRRGFHKPSSFKDPQPGERLAFSDDGHAIGRAKSQSIASLYSRANFSPSTLPAGLHRQGTLPQHHTPSRDGAATPSTINRSTSFPSMIRRNQRTPPCFNLLVAGASGTGKTSFLRTLLGTTKIAKTANAAEVLASVRAFGMKKTGGAGDGNGSRMTRTSKLESLGVEVMNEFGDRLALTVIDTPGFEVKQDDYKVDLAVGSILRYIEGRFDDSLQLEAQVHRNPGRAGDSHVHLVIYFIDPATVVARTTPSSPYAKKAGRSKSATALGEGGHGEDGEDELESSLSPVDLRQIKKLSQRANVLPIIARSDELTNSRLMEVKAAISRDLRREGLSFGVFQTEQWSSLQDLGDSMTEEDESHREPPVSTPELSGEGTAEGAEEDDYGDEAEAEGNRGDDAAWKKGGSRSRRGVGAGSSEDDETRTQQLGTPSANGNGQGSGRGGPLAAKTRRRSVSQRRGSRPPRARPSLGTGFLDSDLADRTLDEPDTPVFDHLLPFSLISPEPMHISSNLFPLPTKSPRRPTVSSAEEGQFSSGAEGRSAPMSKFVRTFRWGTIDVLNPDHCDLSILKAAVLGTHMKLLKDTTRHSQYEQYRTSRLLMRRATQAISEVEKRALSKELEGLAVPQVGDVRLRLHSRPPPVSPDMVGNA